MNDNAVDHSSIRLNSVMTWHLHDHSETKLTFYSNIPRSSFIKIDLIMNFEE